MFIHIQVIQIQNSQNVIRKTALLENIVRFDYWNFLVCLTSTNN